MIHSVLLFIFHKKDILRQSHQPLSYPFRMLIISFFEMALYIRLGRKSFFQIVQAIGLFYKKIVTDIVCMNTKQAIQYIVIDKRTCHHLPSERQAKLTNLFNTQWQRRREMSKQTRNGILRYGPCSEIAENMINSNCIKILFKP